MRVRKCRHAALMALCRSQYRWELSIDWPARNVLEMLVAADAAAAANVG